MLRKFEIEVVILVLITLVKIETSVTQLLEADVTTENAASNGEQESKHTSKRRQELREWGNLLGVVHDICIKSKPNFTNFLSFWYFFSWHIYGTVIIGLQIEESRSVGDRPVPKVLGVVNILSEPVANVGEFTQQLHGIPIFGGIADVLFRILKVNSFIVVTNLDNFWIEPIIHVLFFGTVIPSICFFTSLDFDDG